VLNGSMHDPRLLLVHPIEDARGSGLWHFRLWTNLLPITAAGLISAITLVAEIRHV
jgi:hypothetical protein